MSHHLTLEAFGSLSAFIALFTILATLFHSVSLLCPRDVARLNASKKAEEVTEGAPRFVELGFAVDEILKNGTPLAFADNRRLKQGAATIGQASRCYRLIRRRIGVAGMAAANEAISDLAEGLEIAGSWQLFTAYQTTYGDHREISEIWNSDVITREWYPMVASPETLAALNAVTQEASIHLLNPLPFSKAR